ncbi:hypothetical protein BGZ57DRAFT_238107 [Hyaloscypha finlandica]|nr:hypothetical protein BGZ57DRAFT_238107 [Hyaloscypha finlandica]
MARFLNHFRKSKEAKSSALQPHLQKSETFPGALEEGPTASTPGPSAANPANPEINLTVSNNSTGTPVKPPRDLWQEALDNLDEGNKTALKLRFDDNGKVQPPVTKAIEGVITSIEASFEEYRNGGWKIRHRDGRVIFDVRDNGKKILKCALRSKAIIDSGVKFDPTGYSSTAWTVISIGLQFVQNDQDRMSAVFDASALLAEILHRYANIEAHYRDQDLPGVMDLEDRLRSSYEAILNYVATVEEQRCQQFWGRVWYSLYSLSEQPLQQLKDGILSADNAAKQWRELIEHEYRLKESEMINKKVDEACGKLDRILDGLDRNLMAINRGNQLLQMILVQMGTKGDFEETSVFFQQRMAEGLDEPAIARAVASNNDSKKAQVAVHDLSFSSGENLDQLLQEVFVELRQFEEDSKEHQLALD